METLVRPELNVDQLRNQDVTLFRRQSQQKLIFNLMTIRVIALPRTWTGPGFLVIQTPWESKLCLIGANLT